jgi:hypothetical protein
VSGPVKQGEAAPFKWAEGLSDFQVVMALMKRMGSKSGFSPIPPSQHQWQRAKGEPPLYRMWSWMCDHTIFWGRRCEFAVNVLREVRTIEDVAEDLGMDEGNAYRTWREGVEKGLWRNGTKAEGQRRLYLRGDVPKPKEEAEGEETANDTVCTDSFPPYILNQINKWEPEKQDRFRQIFANEKETLRTAQAELVAALRSVIADREDSLFREFGVKKIREEHPPRKADPDDVAAREARLRTAAPAVQQYVRTVAEFVQTRNSTVYTPPEKNAQTPATLLPQRTTREEPERAAVVSGMPRARAGKPLPNDGKKSLNQLPAVTMPELSGEEREAEDLAFRTLRQAQLAFPHTDFSRELLSPERKCDVVTVRRILRLVSPAYMEPFLDYVVTKFKGLDRNALGALPARSPAHPHGPRSLGLIVSWAGDFVRTLRPLAQEQAKSACQVDPARRAAEIAACRAMLADPNESAYIKQIASDLLNDGLAEATGGR